MKSIDEIYRDFPDEAREKRAAAALRVPEPLPCFRVVIVGFLALTIMVAIAPVPFRGSTSCGGGLHGSLFLMAQVEAALASYEVRHGRYPTGDGSDSRELVGALVSTVDSNGKAMNPIFQPNEELVDSEGNLLNYYGKPFHYRCPGVHNPGRFDLWSGDGRGNPAGIRNWR